MWTDDQAEKKDTGMQVEDLAKQTRIQLLTFAKQHGVKGVSRLRKQELLDRLVQILSVQVSAVSSPGASSFAHTISETVTLTPPPVTAELLLTVKPAPAQPEALPLLAPRKMTEQERNEHAESASIPACQETDQCEQEAVDSKFFLGPQPHVTVSEPATLPASYNDNRVMLLARDPHWLYAYWDFSGEHLSRARNQLGGEAERLVLRVFDVTYIEFNGANAWSSMEIELAPFATNWYLSVPQADAAYCAEIGYRCGNGQFVSLGRSNVATTPRDDISPSTTVRWLTPPARRPSMAPNGSLPRSAFTQEHSVSSADGATMLPAPSSAERPSSWGSARRE